MILDKKGRPTKNDPIRKVMEYALEMESRHVHRELEVVTAFLTEDVEQVRTHEEEPVVV